MISPMSPLGNCKVNKEDNNHNIDNKIQKWPELWLNLNYKLFLIENL